MRIPDIRTFSEPLRETKLSDTLALGNERSGKMGASRTLVTFEGSGNLIATSNLFCVRGLTKKQVRAELGGLLKELKGLEKDFVVSKEAFDIVTETRPKSVHPIFIFRLDQKQPAPELIAYAELHTLDQVIGKTGVVENVVVKPKYQGQGVGTWLMRKVHETARYLELESLELTSMPHRKVAHALYKKLGYKKSATTVLTLDL